MKGLILALLFPLSLHAAELTLAWDPVEDDRVGLYELSWGTASGHVMDSIDSLFPSAVAGNLEGQTLYYFRARACTIDKLLCSPYSEEIRVIPDIPVVGC